MTDILADYREWAAAQPARVSTHSDRCHMYHTECMIHRLARRLEASTLTDAEREAVRFCTTAALPETEKLGGVAGQLCRMHAATLRGLLERTVEK